MTSRRALTIGAVAVVLVGAGFAGGWFAQSSTQGGPEYRVISCGSGGGFSRLCLSPKIVSYATAPPGWATLPECNYPGVPPQGQMYCRP